MVGATLDGRISTKEQVLQEVFRRIGSDDPKDYVLIGDTIYDVEGANKVGMDCIGVSYGFGKSRRFRTCRCSEHLQGFRRSGESGR